MSNSLNSQQWHGKTESVVDVKIIKSICASFYFDHANISGQENTINWCEKTGVSLEDVYSFSSEYKIVIGFEAPVWTECEINEKSLDYRFWPGNIAVEEISWSNDPSKNNSEFTGRLKMHQERLEAMAVNYYPAAELHRNVDPTIR